MEGRKITLLILSVLFVAFTIWVYIFGTNPDEKVMWLGEDAIKGKTIYQQKNCSACHQLFGLGGYLGPELSTVISDAHRGEHYARALLKQGSATMPDFKFTDAEIDQLIAYLRAIDTYSVKRGEHHLHAGTN